MNRYKKTCSLSLDIEIRLMRLILCIMLLFHIAISPLFSNNNSEISEIDKKIDTLYSYTVNLIYPEELNEMLDSDIFILDTRSEKEFTLSHIKDAIFIDYKSFSLDKLPKINKNSKIIIYCTIGYRSEKIGEALLDDGYIDVSNLYGGLINWVNLKFDVYNKNGIVKKIHLYSILWRKYLLNKDYK
ncbi:MAG: rhodanese-like domain-containing protein [Spirochaetaceae bacterium]